MLSARGTALALVCVLLGSVTPAHAQGTVPAGAAAASADPAARGRAKVLFERGASAYAAGRYQEAIESFLETSRVYPNPALAFNIGKAYDNLGSRPNALRYYRDYLRGSPEAPDHEAVTARVRELEEALAERGVQQLTVLSSPEEATVLLDDRPVGVTPWTGETWPGRHRVVVQRAGHAPRETFVELEPLRAADVTLALDPLRPEPVHDDRARLAERVASERSRHRVLTWVVLGVGTAAFATAVLVDASVDSRGRKITPATAFIAGLGAAATTVGGVMLYLDLSSASEPVTSRGAALPGLFASYGETF
jgi:hypothetical protein